MSDLKPTGPSGALIWLAVAWLIVLIALGYAIFKAVTS